jgi:dTDP-4-amino-4,6-dideoxygalactose transaminase
MNDKKPSIPIPMSSPDLTDLERQAVLDVVNTRHLSMGPKIIEFEESIAKYVGSSYAIGVNSGTSGLHLCLLAAGIEPGDLVLTTSFSFISSSNVILYCGAIPVFVDVDPKTGNIDPVLLEQAAEDITAGGERAKKWLPRKGAENAGSLKAILSVDVFGQPADHDEINRIANKYHLIHIEDSCEALGSTYKGTKAGTLGDFGVFAFYPNKQITTGEGGIIVTNNEKAAEFMVSLRNQGRSVGDTWLSHTHLGYNYRLNEMSAALGAAQMTRIDDILASRKQVSQWYFERMSNFDGLSLPHITDTTTFMSWFVFVVHLADRSSREHMADALSKAHIPVRPYFIPIHIQPYFVDRFGTKPEDYPNTMSLGERGLAIPFSGVMTEEQVDIVAQEIKKNL